ncbi:MAG TPA: hypothetical protein VII81_12075 [Terriglobales bacterium]
MAVETREMIQARIREIDERLRDLEACELTEGWVSSGPEIAELTQLNQEREQLLQALTNAA